MPGVYVRSSEESLLVSCTRATLTYGQVIEYVIITIRNSSYDTRSEKQLPEKTPCSLQPAARWVK